MRKASAGDQQDEQNGVTRFHQFAQLCDGLVIEDLDGIDRDAQPFGDFGVGESFVDFQSADCDFLRREFFDGFVELFHQVVALQVGQEFACGSCCFPVFGLCRYVIAQGVERPVFCNAKQVAGQTGGRQKFRTGFPEFEERVLHDIFRQGAVAGVPVRKGVQLPVVFIISHGKCQLIPVADFPGQFVVGHFVRGRLLVASPVRAGAGNVGSGV